MGRIHYVLGLWLLAEAVVGEVCKKGATTGITKAVSTAKELDSQKGFGYLTKAKSHHFDCCGTISEWTVNIGHIGTIRLQVWRPLETGKFLLIGENLATYKKGEENKFHKQAVSPEQRISVQSGDYIGWYNENEPMVAYKKEKRAAGIFQQKMAAPRVGSVVNWSNIKATKSRTYVIGAVLLSNSPPTLKNLPKDVTIDTDVEQGHVVFTLQLDDADHGHRNYLNVSMSANSSFFMFNVSSLQVIVKSPPLPEKYTLTFTVQDQCLASSQQQLNIEVEEVPFISNRPAGPLPTITNLPAGVGVREDVHVETFLYKLDVDYSGPIACSSKGVSPSSGAKYFLVKNVNDTWGVFLKGGVSLSYQNVNNYEVTVKCGVGKAIDLQILIVHVLPNTAPVFLNLPQTISLDANEAIVGNAVFHVQAEDEEGDHLTFSMTCDPDPCPFNMSKGGSMLLKRDFRDNKVQHYYVEIFMKDKYNTVGPGPLQINITGINHPPYIYNLPTHAPVVLMEHTPIGSAIFQVTATDWDNDTLQYYSFVKPSAGERFFGIDINNGTIMVTANLDFEQIKNKNLKITVLTTDGKDTVEEQLKVSIRDQNEAPKFIYPAYTIYVEEGKTGTSIKAPSLKAVDHDKNDAITYALNCGNESSHFSIDSKSAAISMTYEYDVDAMKVPSHTVRCLVTATDKGNLTVAADIDIVIQDSNDNTPTFSRTSYLFVLTKDLPLFSAIGKTPAYDLDTASENNHIEYSIKHLNSPVIIDDNGTLYLTQNLENVNIGTTFEFQIGVKDGNKKTSLSSSVMATAVLLPGNYTTIMAEMSAPELSFWTLPENVIWLISAAHLLLLILFLIFVLLVKNVHCTCGKGNAEIKDKQAFWKYHRRSSAVSADMNSNMHAFVHRSGHKKPSLVYNIAHSEPPPAFNSDAGPKQPYLGYVLPRPRPTSKPNLDGMSSFQKENTSGDAKQQTKDKNWTLEDLDGTDLISSGGKHWPTDDIYPDAQESRKCSVSDIKATYTKTGSLWKPWSISDFKKTSSTDRSTSNHGNQNLSDKMPLSTNSLQF